MLYLFFLGESILALLNVMISFYFSIKIFESTNSASLMALSVFFSIAPNIYLSFFSGRAVDFYGKVKTIKICALLYFSIYLILYFYVDNYGYEIITIFLFLAIRSIVSSFNDMAIITIIPEQVPKENLRVAYGIQDFLNKGVSILGPILSGVIYSYVKVDNIILPMIVISFLIFMISFSLKEVKIVKDNIFEDISLNLCRKIVNQTPELRGSLCFFCLFNLVNGVSSAFLVSYAFLMFGNFSYTLSIYNSFMAVGALIGTLFSIRKINIDPLLLIGISTIICALFGRIVIGFAYDIFLFSIFLALRAALIPIGNMANQIVWVDKTERSSRGSLFGYRRLIAQGFYPISIVLCAMLINIYQLDSSENFLNSMFIITGFFEIIISILLIAFSVRLKRVRCKYLSISNLS